jgi:hypothetical protein
MPSLGIDTISNFVLGNASASKRHSIKGTEKPENAAVINIEARGNVIVIQKMALGETMAHKNRDCCAICTYWVHPGTNLLIGAVISVGSREGVQKEDL